MCFANRSVKKNVKYLTQSSIEFLNINLLQYFTKSNIKGCVTFVLQERDAKRLQPPARDHGHLRLHLLVRVDPGVLQETVQLGHEAAHCPVSLPVVSLQPGEQF